jgi:hypothetical protein
MENSIETSQKTKTRTPIRSRNSLLGIYMKECKPDYNKGNCAPVFTAALFTIAKLWNSQDAPVLMNGLRKCGIYIQLEFYSATKKNEILLFAGRWVELENIILSEVSQRLHVFSHM